MATGTNLLNEYNCLCLQMNPIVGHIYKLLIVWLEKRSQSLIDLTTPLKKIKLSGVGFWSSLV